MYQEPTIHLLFCQMSIHVDVEKSTEVFKAKLGISHIYSIDSNPVKNNSIRTNTVQSVI
jgi:hypothetical protein